MAKKLRGTGLRHTLPYVFRFAGLWLVVTIAAVLAASISSYLVFGERLGDEGAAQLRQVLLIQGVLSILAVLALAVFTTHRLAGPWIAVRRAMEAVRDGDLEVRLRLRATDPRIHEVETAFQDMVESLRRRVPASTAVVAGTLPPTAARPLPGPQA